MDWHVLHTTGPGLWWLGLAASLVLGVSFLAIFWVLARNVQGRNPFKTNPLAIGTSLLFLSCGLLHMLHVMFLIEPWFGIHSAAGEASREVYADWHAYVIDGLTAAAGIWYWRIRRGVPDLVKSSAMFEDLHQRQQRAVEINDNVVQSLALAKLALETGMEEEGHEAVEKGLTASRQIISQLLGAGDVKPGQLRQGESP